MKHAMKLLVSLLVLAGTLLMACSDGDSDDVARSTETATATPAASSTRPATTSTQPARATASATATTTPAATPAASADALAALAALNGTGCTGDWQNETTGASGALWIRIEAGGGGGLMTFEIGGPVFGAQGGVFQAPFRLEGTDIIIDARSEFLGDVDVRAALDGSAAEATMTAPPALGPDAVVTMTDFRYANDVLQWRLDTDYGDGRPHASSIIEAACAPAH